jgi:folylpolyglutamate synthase
VDTAIVEVGVGGEYDGTNIIPRPSVTAVTSLGIDHVNILGNTLESIAWHKGGIFKENVVALTVEQPHSAVEVLRQRAEERKVDTPRVCLTKATFRIVPVHPAMKTIALGIPGKVQQSNASLALAIVEEHLKDLKLPVPDMNSSTLPPDVVTALENVRWPGRCETRVEDKITWYCDGAHTAESIAAATQWYSSMYCIRIILLILVLVPKRRRGYFYSISKLGMPLVC